MVEDVKTAFKTRVASLSWIKDGQKNVAATQAIIDKVSNAQILLGYPDYINDTFHLQNLYAAFNVSEDDYLGNIVSIKCIKIMQSFLSWAGLKTW